MIKSDMSVHKTLHHRNQKQLRDLESESDGDTIEIKHKNGKKVIKKAPVDQHQGGRKIRKLELKYSSEDYNGKDEPCDKSDSKSESKNQDPTIS